jgi:hypothetical protein
VSRQKDDGDQDYFLDEDWVGLNQMIKFGFGRITDCLNEDIRLE